MAKKKDTRTNTDKIKDINELSLPEGRVPPQAVEVEEAVLGAMLIERSVADIAIGMLDTEDFYKPANKTIFEVMQDLHERSNPLDLLTVENELRDQNVLDTVGGATYLSDLTRAVSSAANIEYHAQIIIEKSIKRKLILNCTEVITSSYDTASDAYDVLDDAEHRIFSLSNSKSKSTSKQVKNILKETLQYLEDMRGKKYGITGVPSGLGVDEMTAGWQKGDLVIIAARPSMGKTAFILTAARNAAMHPDESLQTPVAIFSLEMSNQSLVQRLLTMEARVRADEARKGTLDDEGFKRLIDAAGRLFNAPLFIDDTPAITLMELRTKCRQLKSEHNIGMVVIDYLQLMQGNTRDAGNREQEIASISRGLKALAKELDIPIIALSQLSRAVEQRGGDKRPQLSDLRESGSIEQDADVVIFLYRPEYYKIKTTEDGRSTAGLAEVIIGKQRNGPVGTKTLHFISDYARFENFTAAGPAPGAAGNGFGDEDYEYADADTGRPPLPHNPAPDDDDAPF